MFPNGETVTRLRAPAVTDRYNAEKRDWSTAVETDLPGCAVAAGGSVEPLEVGRSSVVSDFDVIAPPATDILATDRLVVRGVTCEVEGQPFDWRHPWTGWQPGMVIKVKAVQG